MKIRMFMSVPYVEFFYEEKPHPFFFMHFCPGLMRTHAESINSDLQRGLDRRLRYTQH